MTKPAAELRDEVLHALDFAYCNGIGYETPEQLLDAYDAVHQPADQPSAPADTDLRVRAAVLREAAAYYENVLTTTLAPGGVANDPRYCTAIRDIVMGLRHMADGAPQAGDAVDHRLDLSEALGLGTGAPWDAIRDRAAELQAAAAPADPASECPQCGDAGACNGGLCPLLAPVVRLAELEAENAALRARLAAPERDRIVVLADGDPMTDALVDGRKLMLTALADAVLALTLETDRPAVLHAAADRVAAQQSWIADLLRKHAEQWQAPELTPEEAAEADRILEQRMTAAEAREAGGHACACGQPGCEHCDVDEAGEGR
jgi:hypothetical protein